MKSQNTIGILSFILVLFFSTSLHANNNSSSLTNLFQLANSNYEKGNYAEAVNNYKEIFGTNKGSAEIHANLARSLYRLDKLGEAIYEIRIASALAPHNSDIKNDLQFLRNLPSDKIEETGKFFIFKLLDNLNSSLSQKKVWIFFIISMFIFWAILSLRLFKPTRWFKWVIIGASVLLITSGYSIIKKTFFTPLFGVVIGESADVLSGPNADNIALFKLHEGAEFNIKATENDWLKISLADGKIGWINKNSVVF